jgi:hypothetical protein
MEAWINALAIIAVAIVVGVLVVFYIGVVVNKGK